MGSHLNEVSWVGPTPAGQCEKYRPKKFSGTAGRTGQRAGTSPLYRDSTHKLTGQKRSHLNVPVPDNRILLEILCQCPNGSELLCIHSARIFQKVLLTYIKKKKVHIAKDWWIKVFLDVVFHQGRPTSTWYYTFDNKIKCHLLNWAFWLQNLIWWKRYRIQNCKLNNKFSLVSLSNKLLTGDRRYCECVFNVIFYGMRLPHLSKTDFATFV